MSSERGFGLMEMLFGLALASFVCLGALSLLDASARSLRASDRALASLEARQVALSSLSASLSRVRSNLCGSAAVWRNHLVLSDASWWSRAQLGSYVYSASETSPGTLFGTAAARRVSGTAALDLYYFERDEGDLLSQDSPSAELRVSSIQGYAAGDVAVVCSPSSVDVFMVSGKSLGRLLHDSAVVNGFGLRNCSESFFAANSCAGLPRCVAGRVSGVACSLPSEIVGARLGHVRAERWYIGMNASGERALYLAELENFGVSSAPTAVRPSEIISGVSDLALSVSSGVGWSVTSGALPLDGSAVQVSLKLSDGSWVRKFVPLGQVAL